MLVFLGHRKFPDKSVAVPPKPKLTQPDQSYNYEVKGLWPGTEYVLQTKVVYETKSLRNTTLQQEYIWPKRGDQNLVNS